MFIWLEMLVVSIFLWYAADALFVMYRLYSQPLGFNIEHTYHVSFGVIPEESPIMTRPPCIASGEAGIT